MFSALENSLPCLGVSPPSYRRSVSFGNFPSVVLYCKSFKGKFPGD
jgi:hypothetical protein